MLAVVQSPPFYRCLKVVCIGGTPVGVSRIVTVRLLGVSGLRVAYQIQR
jgi:hypothetical protein